jgi:hypothetical protein
MVMSVGFPYMHRFSLYSGDVCVFRTFTGTICTLCGDVWVFRTCTGTVCTLCGDVYRLSACAQVQFVLCCGVCRFSARAQVICTSVFTQKVAPCNHMTVCVAFDRRFTPIDTAGVTVLYDIIQRCTKFSKAQVPAQNSRRQKGDKKQVILRTQKY